MNLSHLVPESPEPRHIQSLCSSRVRAYPSLVQPQTQNLMCLGWPSSPSVSMESQAARLLSFCLGFLLSTTVSTLSLGCSETLPDWLGPCPSLVMTLPWHRIEGSMLYTFCPHITGGLQEWTDHRLTWPWVSPTTWGSGWHPSPRTAQIFFSLPGWLC